MHSRILKVIAEALRLEPGQLDPGSSYENTEGWDSLAMLRIIDGLESEFDVELDPEEMAELNTVADITDCVTKLVGAGS